MKKFYVFLMLLLAMTVAAKANPVSVQQARKVGAKYLTQSLDVKAASEQDLKLAATYRTESGVAAFYIFNGPGSFVIVSADDCATPILGSSATNQFYMDDIPPALEEYLQGFVEQIQYGIESRLPALDTVAHQWETVRASGLLRNDRATAASMSPLLTTTWGQGSSSSKYNIFCPTDSRGPNGHAITGCVATAMGQIMRYWRYPISGTGSHGYYPPKYPSQYQFVNFGNAVYDWDNMPNELNSSSTDAQNNAVATLLWHCGVSVDMNYYYDNSGAVTSEAADALEDYFNYSSDLHYDSRSSFSDNEWLNKLKADLNKGRPVLYRGRTPDDDAGHAFVCDGYNADNALHFNWGWSGSYQSDYYALDALTPGSDNYSYSNAAIFEIHPNCGRWSLAHYLPYSEDFEAGYSNFECYLKGDFLASGYKSSWTTHASNSNPNVPSGNICATRPYNPTSSGNCNDFFILEPVFLQPGRDASTLTFKTYEQFASDYTFESVCVFVGASLPTNLSPSDFTQIWTQNSPSASWKTVSIDLNAYRGQYIYIAFRYTGTNGHSWYIDDINITQSWTPCSGPLSLPYNVTFDSNVGGCWYIIDSDMSGDNKCWQWHADSQSVWHPKGQEGYAQTGWLISRRVFLQPGRDETKLTFSAGTTNATTGSGKKNTVWIAVDKDEDVLAPSDFTKIWEDQAYSSNWTSYNVDLSAYQGHFVNIAFKYEGTYSHNWFIDNVNITESWTPCSAVTAPVSEPFNSSLSDCWYVIDSDRSGGERCWKYDETEHCVFHPWGQQDIAQEGWLFSRRVWLPSSNTYKLSFKSKTSSNGTGRKNSVRIAVDKTGTPNPSDYTEIWVDPSYNGSWTTYEIDLSAYSGHYVNIAFKYEGTYAHKWYVDDFSISQVPTYNITASASPSAGGSVSGGGTFNEGATCTLTATANSGYQFVNWTKNGTQVSTNPTYSFTVTSSGTYVANFQALPSGSQLTVYPNASSTDNHIPMYVYYFDDFTRVQHVIPASELTAMSGGQILAVKYYTNSDNIPYSSVSEIDFYLKEVSSPTLTSYIDKSSAQIVYHGTVNFFPSGSGGEVTVSFTTPFNYNGGNLLVGCDNTTDMDYKNIKFIGDTGHTNAAIYGSNGTSSGNVTANSSSFLPKSTFTYTGGGGGGTTQTTNFTSGWNWWSSYVELNGSSLNTLEDGLGTHGVMIKSQNNGYASYLSGYGWYGSLSAINNECTYQVETDAACTVSLSGNAANPASHPVTLTSGWTWVGYPVNASMSVSTALGGITPQNGDMLKSQNNGYASYLSGYGWYGSLSTLNPGMGLMYKSNRSSSITLTYPNGGSKGELKSNQTAEGNHWQPNLSAYPDNMSVMAVVELDGEELASERYELAAFANGECRGSARLMYVEPLDRYMAFLTVAGDEATGLHFGLYNVETGDVETQNFASLQYETNAVVGSFDNPYVVSFRNNTSVDEWTGSVNLFPNPVERGQKVSLGLPSEEKAEVRVEIVNTLGMVVETLHVASEQTTITAPKVAGVYTLGISVEGKGTCYRKLVVR